MPIDYDPGATRVNQENRIKLMLAVAAEESSAPEPEAAEPAREEAGAEYIKQGE